MKSDKLSLWRLASRLSVEDAAILIAGGDPSEEEDGFDPIGEAYYSRKLTTEHKGFTPAFEALKQAIKHGDLRAEIHYWVEPLSSSAGPHQWIILTSFARGDDDIYMNIEGDKLGRVAVTKEPDWGATTVDVEDLRNWLRSRGFETGFFFPSAETDPLEFMDPSHEHFSPELCLAVLAWRAMAEVSRFPRGAKDAIEGWITKNQDAWKGSEPLSKSALERVTTVVNWKRSGGAPTVG